MHTKVEDVQSVPYQPDPEVKEESLKGLNACLPTGFNWIMSCVSQFLLKHFFKKQSGKNGAES